MTGGNIDPTTIFATKAEIYDRFRWDYAPEAIEFILNHSGVNKSSSMADIGAGTGILTRHFLDRVGIVYAVEPNQAMRRVSEERHRNSPAFHSITRRAESTALMDNCLDLVVVGQALHWFEPNRTPVEFWRILKQDGWLAVIWNRFNEGDLSQSLNDIFARYSSGLARRTDHDLLPPYFRGADYRQPSFGVERRSGWDQFLGGLTTASWAPDAKESAFEGFQEEARTVFDRFSSEGKLTIEVITHVAIGRPNVKHDL